MKTKLIPAILSLGLFSSTAIAQQPKEGWSNSGKIKYEVRGGEDTEKKIWLLPEGKKEGAQLLTESFGWGNLRVHISPNDNIIVLCKREQQIAVSL